MNDFNPDWISPPGHTIQSIMEERGINLEEFAKFLELSVSETKNLLIGEVWLSPEIARALPDIIGSTEKFWLRRELIYRYDKERLNISLND